MATTNTTMTTTLLQNLVAQATSLIKSQPFTTAAATGILTLLAYLIHDIRSYIALGPHGLPDTIWGWYRQLRMTPNSRRDTCVPLPRDIDFPSITSKYPAHGTQSFLPSPLEPRSGPRPSVCKFVAPQRQYTDRASESTKSAMFGYLEDLARANPTWLAMRGSVLEGSDVPALQLSRGGEGEGEGEIIKGAPELLYFFKFMKNPVAELVHIHPPDGSTHIELSLEDSRLVIEKGWGQRHRLSGKVLPWGYTLLYAPRNEEEMEVWKRVVGAALGFVSEGVEGWSVVFP